MPKLFANTWLHQQGVAEWGGIGGREGGREGVKEREPSGDPAPSFCCTRVCMGSAEKVPDQEARNKSTIQCRVSDLPFNRHTKPLWWQGQKGLEPFAFSDASELEFQASLKFFSLPKKWSTAPEFGRALSCSITPPFSS